MEQALFDPSRMAGSAGQIPPLARSTRSYVTVPAVLDEIPPANGRNPIQNELTPQPYVPLVLFHVILVLSGATVSRPERALSALVREQHQVFSARQASRLGIGSTTLSRWVGSGRIDAEGNGVYRMAGSPPTWEGSLMALTLQTGGAASHRSAARLRGFDTYQRDTRVEVTVAHGRGSAIPSGTVHQTRAQELMEVDLVRGIPCVAPSRVLVDLAAVVNIRRLSHAVDDLRRDRLAPDDDLRAAAMLHLRRGRPGMAMLHAVLARELGTEVTDSTFEYLVLRLFRDAGLLDPVVHHRVYDDSGEFIAEVDLAYPHVKVAVELDSKLHHFNHVSFERDPRKRIRMAQAGWFVVPVTWQFAHADPAGLVRTVRDAIARQTTVLIALGELPRPA